MAEVAMDFLPGRHRKPRITDEDWGMDSHEARALLRSSPWVGYHQDERQAIGILVADIHEMIEEIDAQMRQDHPREVGDL